SIPLQERSRAVAVVFGGLSVGSILGYVWFQIWAELLCFLGSGEYLSRISNFFSASSYENYSWNDSLKELGDSLERPSSLFLPHEKTERLPARGERSRRLALVHWLDGTNFYMSLDDTVDYIIDDNTSLLQVSILPSLGSILITSMAAPLADNLISNGVETTTVKVHIPCAKNLPNDCLYVSCNLHDTFLFGSRIATLGSCSYSYQWFGTFKLCLVWYFFGFFASLYFCSKICLNEFHTHLYAGAGLYCTHQDISPKYASILLLSLFAPSIFFYLTGTVVWLTFASSKPQNFSE
ncbi:hypothetical protein GW17_00042141, partial [Ensete ventricosum]